MFNYILVACTLLCFSESAKLNLPQKCSFHNIECKKALYKSIVNTFAAGDSDMGMPPLDPVKITGVSANFPDSMELTLSDGLFEGMKDCSYSNMNTNIEKEYTTIKLTCKVNFNGKFKIKGGQDSVNGEGNGIISLDGLQIITSFPISVQSRGGDTYLAFKSDEITYSYEVTGDIKFTSDDLGLGDKNEKIVSYLNENTNVIKDAFLPTGLKSALAFYHKFVDNIISKIPTKNFITTDLTSFIKT